jgi:F0F1-type ATP synthase membrane subunit b/b'
MRRANFAVALGLAFASYVLPQDPSEVPVPQAQHEAETGDPWIWWKWINFLILVGGLGYMAAKFAPPMFRARSEEIQQALADAAKVKKDAEAQAANIEHRLNNLQIEIENLRQTAQAEAAAEGERIRQETERRLTRIQEQSAQEIVLMTRAARHELRKYSADLAVSLASQRIRSRMTPEIKQNLMDGFLDDLRSRMPAATRT